MWVKKELPAKLKHKKEASRGCKQGQVAWDKCTSVRAFGDEVKTAKAQMELNLFLDVQDKEGFWKQTGGKGQRKCGSVAE